MRAAEAKLLDCPPDIFSSLHGLAHVALAVSGGSDSIAMLHMVCAWAKMELPKPTISVLTVDHGLRAEAAVEALLVKGWCAEIGVGHVSLNWAGPKPATGVQAKARAARYELMTQWCKDHAVSVLLTAHTVDDQAETVAMRLARTHTAKSLAAIWPVRDWNGVQVMRPLLNLRRAELQKFLRERGQSWISDPSNDDAKYERVRVRKALAGDVELAERAITSQASVMANAVNAKAWVRDGIQISDIGMVRFSISDFSALPEAIQDDVLIAVLKISGATQVPELRKRLAFLGWLNTLPNGRRCIGGIMFHKRGGQVFVAREPGRIAKEPAIVPAGGQIIWDNRFRIYAPAGAQVLAAQQDANLPKRRDILAFVAAGLPIVLQNGRILDENTGVKCEFIGSRHL